MTAHTTVTNYGSSILGTGYELNDIDSLGSALFQLNRASAATSIFGNRTIRFAVYLDLT